MKRTGKNPFTIWLIAAAIIFLGTFTAAECIIAQRTAATSALKDSIPSQIHSDLTAMADYMYTAQLVKDDEQTESLPLRLASCEHSSDIIYSAIQFGARLRLINQDGSVIYDSDNSPIVESYDGKYSSDDEYSAAKNGTVRILAAGDAQLSDVNMYYMRGNTLHVSTTYNVPARTAALISDTGEVEYCTLLYSGQSLGEDDSDYAQYFPGARASDDMYMMVATTGTNQLLVFTYSAKNAGLMRSTAEIIGLYDAGTITALLIAALTSGMAAIILMALWVFCDAKKRQMRAALWGTLMLIGNVVALTVYLIVRHGDKSDKPEDEAAAQSEA